MQMKKYDFEYCMKHDCNSCKRFKECEKNEHKKKNKNSNKRIKQKRKKDFSFRSSLSKD